MPLETGALKDAILAALTDNSNIAVDPNEESPEAIAAKATTARGDIAQKLANAIEAFVKSGEVKTDVTGSSASGGPVTGIGTGNIL